MKSKREIQKKLEDVSEKRVMSPSEYGEKMGTLNALEWVLGIHQN